jgi:hypothetical protein
MLTIFLHLGNFQPAQTGEFSTSVNTIGSEGRVETAAGMAGKSEQYGLIGVGLFSRYDLE